MMLASDLDTDNTAQCMAFLLEQHQIMKNHLEIWGFIFAVAEKDTPPTEQEKSDLELSRAEYEKECARLRVITHAVQNLAMNMAMGLTVGLVRADASDVSEVKESKP